MSKTIQYLTVVYYQPKPGAFKRTYKGDALKIQRDDITPVPGFLVEEIAQVLEVALSFPVMVTDRYFHETVYAGAKGNVFMFNVQVMKVHNN